jgi:hypothetical protein
MSGILERLETKMDKLIELIGKGTSAEIGKAMDDLTSPEVTAQAGEHVAPITVQEGQTVEVTVSNDPYAGVDKDGVEWDARIHSKAKEPKSVTTGKWKRKKGISDDLYNNTMAELKASATNFADAHVPVTATTEGPFFWMDTATKVSNTCDTRAEMDEVLQIPTTKELTQDEFDALLEVPAVGPKVPNVPNVPNVPKAPTAPIAPPAPVESSVKSVVLGLIKDLTTEYRVEPNDITALMVEVTAFDTIGKIEDSAMVKLRDALTTWHDTVADATNAVTGMTTIAEPLGFTADLNAGIEGILEPHDADCVGLVHYSAIAGVNDQLQAYLKTWQEL